MSDGRSFEQARGEADARRTSERIVSAISRRLALAQGEAIDPVIVGGLEDVARHIGADAAALLRTAPDDSIEFIATWFDPARGPLPFRTDHKSTSYDWVRTRLSMRGPQIIDMREIVARVGSPSAASEVTRFVGVIGTFAGDRVVGALCFYFRRDVARPEVTELEPFEVLGDIMLGTVSRRDAELALRASEQRYRTIVETSGEGIWTMTADWRVAFANGRIAAMLGWSVDELVGRPLLEFIADSARAKTLEAMARHERGTSELVETTFRRRDGSLVQVRLSASPLLDDAGRFAGGIGVVQDVTEELRLQTELAAARRLEALGQLAGGVAHDINNALTVILAHATKATRTASGPELAAFTEIAASGRRASEVAHQLLTFARREPMQPRTLDAGGLARDLVPMIAQLVGAHIAVTCEIAGDRWAVRADPVALERVLLNLAANARDAMADGGTLTLRVANRTVSDASEPVTVGDYVAIEVCDTGHGMSEDVLARVFEPFFTTKAERSGTGLGLASAYGAMQQLGGGIDVTSTLDTGTCVTLYCPRSHAAIDAPSPRAHSAVAPATRRVLYVEDLEPLRAVIARTLEDAGYTVLTAGDGDEATQIADSEDDTIDVLVTDVVLPRMNGYRIASRLRERRPALRVLYLSGYDRPQGLDEALAEPGTAFLAKPFAPDALIAELERLLRM